MAHRHVPGARFLPLLVLAAVLAGCDSLVGEPAPTPAVDGATSTADAGTVPSTVTVNGYTVEFKGVDITGTTFSYEVTGVDPGPPAFDWFFLENACGDGPVALQPDNAVDEDTEVNGIRGVKWNASLSPGKTRTYSYTFANAQLGFVRTAVSRGSQVEMATLPGPCGGFLLEGFVFVNGDTDHAKGEDELGIADVLIEVLNNEGTALVSSAVTAADGSYSFLLPGGTYTLRVPTSGEGVFNATLYGSYNATDGSEPTERVVELTSDRTEALGFNPDRGKIIQELTEGDFQTQARDVKFWEKAVRAAIKGSPSCDSEDPETVCRGELEGYLDQIFSGDGDSEFYLLEVPYELPDGADKFEWAAEVLSRPVRSELEVVTRNLFAMELNRLNGWGSPDPEYDDALMSYLEGWVKRGGVGLETSSAVSSSSDITASAVATSLEEDMTLAYLGGGGGGDVGQ